MRSMEGWWRRDPFFVRYMMREATALIVALYALVLLAGALCLSQGEAAWNGWLAGAAQPGLDRAASAGAGCDDLPHLELVRDHAQDDAGCVRRRQAA